MYRLLLSRCQGRKCLTLLSENGRQTGGRLARWNHAAAPKTMLKPLEKVLIANRGEIACRIMNTAKRMGIRTVAVYSDVDSDSLHVQMADEAYLIGPASATHSYLNQEVIIDTAIKANADAIHPGYGFLSENASFAERVLANGLIFVGPPIQAIKDMGIKSTAKEIMSKAGVPVVPGYHGSEENKSNQENNFLLEEAIKIGFPVMIKAIKGGGGKGMRVSTCQQDFIEQLNSSRRESLKAFGDDEVLIEKFIVNPRHVEVQVFADSQGHCVHLFERDCSVQRRHQKVIEESPGPGIDHGTRMALGSTGVRAALAVGYVGAGTVEFILDPKDRKYYFMEMNTRLQVEHPVTEMVSMVKNDGGQLNNVDLVEWQLRIASGEELPVKQQDISLYGHSFEARIYAEDTANNFIPGSGTLDLFRHPGLGAARSHSHITDGRWSDVRIETGVRSGDEVSVHYDPMIAKVVVWDKNRNAALSKLNHVLSKTQIVGLETNVDFLMRLASHDEFKKGVVHTNFIEQHKNDLLTDIPPSDEQVIVCAFGSFLAMTKVNQSDASFRLPGIVPPTEHFNLRSSNGNNSHVVQFTPNFGTRHNEKKMSFSVLLDAKNYGQITGTLTDHLSVTLNGVQSKYDFVSSRGNVFLFADNGSVRLKLDEPSFMSSSTRGSNQDAGSMVVKAVMPGIIEKIVVKEGDQVKAGDPVAIMIAMKMEYTLRAGSDGVVKEILFKEGNNVPKGAVIVKLE